MKRKLLWMVQLLAVGVLSLLMPLIIKAQSGNVGLPFLNFSNDPQSLSRGGAYFDAEPTALSGSQFVANLTNFINPDSYESPINLFGISKRNYNRGSLESFEYSHTGPYDHGHGNAYTAYVRYFNGGQGSTPFYQNNDANDFEAGFGIAQPIGGGWSMGFNMNIINAVQLPSLTRNVNDGEKYMYTNGAYIGTNWSISYNGADPASDPDFYTNFAGSVNNLGHFITGDENYKKTPLPIDVMAAIAVVIIFENGNRFTMPINYHYGLSSTSNGKSAYLFTTNVGWEYNINFKRSDTDGIDLGIGFIDDNAERFYSGPTCGVGVRLKNFALRVSHFFTPGIESGAPGTPIGNTTLIGLTFNLK